MVKPILTYNQSISYRPLTWVIWNRGKDWNDEHLFWSNAIGWVDLDSADTFTTVETERLTLPIGGAAIFSREVDNGSL